MSRWAEAFAALSRDVDTVDTSRQIGERPPTVSQFVHSVTAVAPAAEACVARAWIDGLARLHLDCPLADVPPGRWQNLLDDTTAEHDGKIPRTWAEGFATLSSMPPPVGFSSERWQRVINGAGIFVDQWAAEAAACGWSDLDVFGCNPDRPDARFDAMGLLLLLDRVEVVGIDKEGADLITETGRPQRFRRRALPPDTVPLWGLSRQ